MQNLYEIMEFLTHIIVSLNSFLLESVNFSNVLALLAVIIAYIAFRSTKKVAQGQLFATLLKEYASVEMCNSIRILRKWYNEKKDNAVKDWWSGLTNEKPEPEAIKVDKARRYVGYYFDTAKQLKRKDLLSSDMYEIIVNQLQDKDFKDLFDKTVKPMTDKITTEDYPTLPEILGN